MRALITGGAGFIGSHLAEAHLARGDDVHVIDDLSTGVFDNIAHLKAHKRFGYSIASVTQAPLLTELVDQSEVVYHLAAAVGVQLIVESPVRTIETNVRGTEVVLEVANKKKRKVMVASTSEVYGKSEKVPFSETDDITIGPTHLGRWAYACSKAIDEFLALAYWNEKKLPLVVVRLFNTVGPRQIGRYGMVLPRFVGQALRNDPITVYGSGEQQRSFTSVHDVVPAMMKLMDSDDTCGEVFNIGNGKETSILELAEAVKKITNSTSEIVYVPYEEAYAAGFEDMQRRVPDLTKIKKTIEYEPQFDLPEIIQGVVAHMQGS